MPKDFERCIQNGGKVKTVKGPNKEHKLKEGQFVKFCTLQGKTYKGYVKTKTSHYRKD